MEVHVLAAETARGAPRLALAWLKVQRVQGDSKAIAAAAAGRKLSGHARSTLQLLELWRGALVDALTYTAKEARALEVAKLVQAVHHARLTLCTTPRKQLRCTVWPRRARVAERRQAQGGHDGVAVGGCQDLPPSLAELCKGGKFTRLPV